MLHRRVRILIGGNLEAAAARVLNQLQRRARLAPQPGAANLQVIDVHRQARDFGDGNCLLDFLDQLKAFAADVAAVVAAVSGGDLRHREDLFRVVIAAAFVRRRQADRALLHRLRDQRRHFRQRRRVGRPLVVAHHRTPDLLRRDAGRDIDRDALPLQPREVPGDGRPVDVEVVRRFICGLKLSSTTPSSGAIDWLSPRTSSVTPWRTALCAVPSTRSGISECVWRSMKPGETTVPAASTTSAAALRSSEPIAAMRPSRMPTSARYHRIAGPVDNRAVRDDDVVACCRLGEENQRDRRDQRRDRKLSGHGALRDSPAL